MIKLSIIVPVFNVKPYLRRCLDSILNQSFSDFEVIIVDDGSNDGSGEIIDEYAKRDQRIRVIHKENGGLMSAWTKGVRESVGDYIGFVDSDDYILPEMYERLVTHANESDADIVISNYLINGNIKGNHPINRGLYNGVNLKESIQCHIFPSQTTYSISMSRMPKLYKRSVIVDNLIYTTSLSRTFEDRYIVPAAILSAKSVFYTDEAYYCWMLREGSNHGMYKENLLDDIKRVYNVQHQIVLDKMPLLQKEWEEAYLDYIRLYVDRNIIRIPDLKTKLKSANALFVDDLTKERLDKYGYQMHARLGRAVMLAYKLNSPLLLALASYLTRVKG